MRRIAALILVAAGGCFASLDERALTGGPDGGGAPVDAPLADRALPIDAPDATTDDAATGDAATGDAATGDAATGDAAASLDAATDSALPVDATVDDLLAASPDLATPPSRCPGAGGLFCEGFEAPLSASWSSVVQPSGASCEFAIDPTRSFRGGSSLRVKSPAVPSSGKIQCEEVLDLGASPPLDAFFRAFVYLSSPAPTVPLRFMGLGQGVSPYLGLDLQDASGDLAVNSTIAVGFQPTSVALPVDQWFCLEWEVRQGSPGAIKVWLASGAQILTSPATPIVDLSENTKPNPPLAELQLGLHVATGNPSLPSYEAWYDELIVDTSRVGCAR